jgi:hypothetical protein
MPPQFPFQTIDAFGGLSLQDLPEVIKDGVLCTAGLTVPSGTQCDIFNTVLFVVYCTIDFSCYAFGLYVIKTNGGANLMVIGCATALPLQQLLLCSPVVGSYKSSFFWSDAIALVLVLMGFGVYQTQAREGQLYDKFHPEPALLGVD